MKITLAEYLIFHYSNLTQAEFAKYHLVCKYESKVSERLKKERDAIFIKGLKAPRTSKLVDLMYQENPLLRNFK